MPLTYRGISATRRLEGGGVGLSPGPWLLRNAEAKRPALVAPCECPRVSQLSVSRGEVPAAPLQARYRHAGQRRQAIHACARQQGMQT